MMLPAMTRHDFEAWLDHHVDQPVLVSGAASLAARSRTRRRRQVYCARTAAASITLAMRTSTSRISTAADFGGEEWSLNSLGRARSSISR